MRHSNVVDEHFVRELSVVYFESGPVACNGDIQDKEERLVEFFGVAGVVFDEDFVVHEVIHKHADVLFVPCELVVVELRDIEFEFLITVIFGVVAVGCILAAICPMVGAVHDVFAVHRFDDVDFAAGWPAYGVDVLAE